MSEFATAVDREADWLKLEPLVGYSALTGDDGPFDYIGPRPKRLSQHPRQVHVFRERYTERRIATGTKWAQHDLVLAVLWPLNSPERSDSEQAALDDGLDRLVERVRGRLIDHDHGGRFFAVVETEGVNGAIEVRYPDWRTIVTPSPVDAPLAPGHAYVVEVRYPAFDVITEEI